MLRGGEWCVFEVYTIGGLAMAIGDWWLMAGASLEEHRTRAWLGGYRYGEAGGWDVPPCDAASPSALRDLCVSVVSYSSGSRSPSGSPTSNTLSVIETSP